MAMSGRVVQLTIDYSKGLNYHTSGLTALDRSLVDAGVSHHVGRGEVAHHEGVFPRHHLLHHLLRHPVGIHLRLQIVGVDFRRGDHASLLPVEDRLTPAVEEEGNVGVLLRLGAVELGDSLGGEPLGQHVHVLHRAEQCRERELGLVLSHPEYYFGGGR
jgi:hypothetical protein